MNPVFCLDTSALVAHCLREPGMAEVESLLQDPTVGKIIAPMSILELSSRLRTEGFADVDRKDVLTHYLKLVEVENVTAQTANIAEELRESASERIPTVDVLIAATARLRDATLVHRDPHLTAIPTALVRQIVLPSRPRTTVPGKG